MEKPKSGGPHCRLHARCKRYLKAYDMLMDLSIYTNEIEARNRSKDRSRKRKGGGQSIYEEHRRKGAEDYRGMVYEVRYS